MDIKGMRYFISAAENLSFTRTALEHSVTQTAISLCISKMEEELGFQLFYRKNRAVQLTEAGRVFYEKISDIVKKYEEAAQYGLDTSNGKVGELRIGVADYMMGMSLVSSIRVFQEAYPQLNVKAVIIPPCEVVQAIDAHEIDAAIGFPQEFESDTDLQYRVFRRDKLLVAMAQHHVLASCSDITLEQLSSQIVTVVTPQKAPMVDRYMRNLWAKADFQPRKVIHAPSLEDALLDVAIGNAIILISEQSRNFCSPSLVYHQLKAQEGLDIEIAIAWDSTQDNPVIRGFLWALLGDNI